MKSGGLAHRERLESGRRESTLESSLERENLGFAAARRRQIQARRRSHIGISNTRMLGRVWRVAYSHIANHISSPGSSTYEYSVASAQRLRLVFRHT
jgi:hypothetical protein